MGFASTSPDNDRQLSMVSPYPFIHTTLPTDIRLTTLDRDGYIDILMFVEYPNPHHPTTQDRN